METIVVPGEQEFKLWIKEALKEYFEKSGHPAQKNGEEEPLLGRKEIAAKLRISLVTLTDWDRRGLPHHKVRNRVYFLYSEVIDYIKKNRKGEYKITARLME